ncbi:MAG: peptidoglycan-binding protein [Kamptonema sp. SIO4C4]|nr:peptidoglycan-binding protein [Kamptonema sp. SIO4C4]
MMESLSYLHHAVTYETEHDSPELETGENQRSLPWKKWGAVVLGVSVGLLGISQRALAGGTSLALLQQGDRSTAVKNIQEKLNQLGYLDTQPTGYFGELTQNAVTQLQKDRGVIADGIVGPTTQALLQPVAASPAPQKTTSDILKSGDRSEAVQSLQQQLTDLGVYSGPITGYFGPKTQAAVRHFQHTQGLTVDGIVGEKTQTAMLAAIAPPPASDPPATPSRPSLPPLTQGSQGQRVSLLQQRLQVLGYLQTPPSGTFDEPTQQALQAFQTDQKLTPDGILGNQTRLALETAVSPAKVQDLQKRLQTGGFYTGPIDGVWGKQTQAALKAAQQVYGVSAADIFQGNY